MLKCLLPLLIFLVASLACQILCAQTATVNYGVSAADFPNPERGFYRHLETHTSNFQPLDAPYLASLRNLNMSFGANYATYSALIFRFYILDNFTTSNISASILNQMTADCSAARTAGVKLILRFAYTNTPVSGCGGYCPPYGDASKSQVLTHIGQLTPLLTANKDIIAVVQMGFIGLWGENYYTDYFGDPSLPNGQGYISSTNWTDRKDILAALLNVVPSDRMVQVRIPQMKQKFVYGNAAGTSTAASPPITPGQAHNGSSIARIGFHNDCLLAAYADSGTYNNYDFPAPPDEDTTNLKPYFANDSKYVASGGETCEENNPYDNCAASSSGAYADTELRRMHYSYLNADYNHAVNNDWTGICMEDIKKNLGYRFVLQSGTYSTQAQPGQTISVNISLKNEGYAAPFNPRGVELILRNTATAQKWYALLPNDPRFWLGNGATHSISQTLCIPANMPLGTYDLLLNLPDPTASIYNRPEYAIRLANSLPGGADVWEASTGYNKLGHSIIVNGTATNAACGGQMAFELSSSFSDACTPMLMVSGVPVPGGAYRSSGDLTSSNASVAAGTAVLFQSNTGVLLQANFMVEPGADFEAGIGTCSQN